MENEKAEDSTYAKVMSWWWWSSWWWSSSSSSSSWSSLPAPWLPHALEPRTRRRERRVKGDIRKACTTKTIMTTTMSMSTSTTALSRGSCRPLLSGRVARLVGAALGLTVTLATATTLVTTTTTTATTTHCYSVLSRRNPLAVAFSPSAHLARALRCRAGAAAAAAAADYVDDWGDDDDGNDNAVGGGGSFNCHQRRQPNANGRAGAGNGDSDDDFDDDDDDHHRHNNDDALANRQEEAGYPELPGGHDAAGAPPPPPSSSSSSSSSWHNQGQGRENNNDQAYGYGGQGQSVASYNGDTPPPDLPPPQIYGRGPYQMSQEGAGAKGGRSDLTPPDLPPGPPYGGQGNINGRSMPTSSQHMRPQRPGPYGGPYGQGQGPGPGPGPRRGPPPPPPPPRRPNQYQQRPPPPSSPGPYDDAERYDSGNGLGLGPAENGPSSFAAEGLAAAAAATTATTATTTTAGPGTGIIDGGGKSTPPSMDLSQFDKDIIFRGLKRLYRKKILPLELCSKYGHFHSPPLGPSDFEAKPMVLLLGQYSVGKTSFIRYLLGRDFPGIRIGPEPTTDRFTAVMLGDVDKIVPGAALCSQADRPFRGLSPFGNNFLSRFEGVELDSPVLRNVTLVDTPGILAGQKQSIGRNYDYDAVMRWFAERSDLIIIMFDAHKLDISDELKRVIELMKPHSDKLRVVLNKADCVSTQHLMRVYGALMWNLGKVMMTPEVCRVYMGSFWGAPLQNTEQATLLNREKLDLFNDIAQLPQNAVMRRINELVKRARAVKVHAYIIHYLRKQLPYTWGKKEKQRRLIDRLEREFVMCARRYELPRGDFPPVEPFRQALLEIKDLSEFPKLDKRLVKEMDRVFSQDIPELLEKARDH